MCIRDRLKSPVILGVSEGAGKYMTGFKTVTAMVDAMVDSLGITVPVALHLDHGTYELSLIHIEMCIRDRYWAVRCRGAPSWRGCPE